MDKRDVAAYSISEFCKAHSISRSLFYDLLRDGLAPDVMLVGSRTLISVEGAARWRGSLDAPYKPRGRRCRRGQDSTFEQGAAGFRKDC